MPTTHPQLLYFGSWIQDYPDPQNWLSVFWTCDSTFAKRVGYCNEEFDELTELGDTTIDPEERLTYYEQAGQILVDDVPVLPLQPHPASSSSIRASPATPRPRARFEWPGSTGFADDHRQDGVTAPGSMTWGAPGNRGAHVCIARSPPVNMQRLKRSRLDCLAYSQHSDELMSRFDGQASSHGS